MYGAIIGDILGSIDEKIPNIPQRIELTPTDDSIITCACYEWCHSITDTEIILLDNESTQKTLLHRAIDYLKKWALLFPENGVFSPAFTLWAKQKSYNTKEANTNGCIMRSSPISQYAFIKKLSDIQRYTLLSIFCKTTHNHEESFLATNIHSDLILQSLKYPNLQQFRESFKDSYFSDIKSLDFWTCLANSKKSKFIWSATESLEIVLSAISQCNTYEETFEYFRKIGGDVDTYAAIAGPICQSIFDYSSQYKQAHDILKNNDDIRIHKILSIFNQMRESVI